VQPPGQPLDRKRRRKGLGSMAFGAGLLTFALWGGRSWWRSVERHYQEELYQPFRASAAIADRGGSRVLQFRITDSVWTTRRPRNLWERFSVSPLVPDHGKLMHLFMIRRGDRDAFAHLHPVSTDSMTFESALGRIPAGRYQVYADVVHETGFPQTMVATVDVPAGSATEPLSDPDDAVFLGKPTEARFTLPDGATVTWDGKPASVQADQDAGLKFVVREADGSIARLPPYLGMAAHAVVHRDDDSVYVHLHPTGTISMVAQAALGGRQRTDTLPGMLARRLSAPMMGDMAQPMFDGTVTFPYAFPKPGAYRIWVQVRRPDGVATAPFDVVVR
jgi:hypothetical protein